MIARLTRRQAAALLAVTVLGVTVVGAAVLDLWRLAIVALGGLGVLIFVGVLQARRRVAELRGAIHSIQRLARDLQSSMERVQATQRRMLAMVEEERRSAIDRQRAVLGQLRKGSDATAASFKRLEKGQGNQTQEVEALLQLFRDFEPRAPMPSSGDYALDPTHLLELVFLIERTRPKLVLELGSGTSSIWMGYLLQRWNGRLVAADHDPGYAQATRMHLKRHGLDDVATVLEAPLRPLTVDGETFEWYDTEIFEDLADVDLLVVDGPPGATGPLARYPAVRVLEERLSANATVVLDDMDRADERAVLDRWLESVKGLGPEASVIGDLAILPYTRPAVAGTVY